MKVYVNHLNIELASHFADTFKPFLHRTEQHTQLYTNEGLYRIEGNGQVYRLEPHDRPVVLYPTYFKELTLVADHSTWSKHPTPSVHGHQHAVTTIQSNVYKMPSHTHVSWVIQYKEEDKTTLVPYNMYFEVDQCAFVTETQREKKKKEDRSIDRKYDVHRNIDDPFIKGEIIEFLSHLF